MNLENTLSNTKGDMFYDSIYQRCQEYKKKKKTEIKSKLMIAKGREGGGHEEWARVSF